MNLNTAEYRVIAALSGIFSLRMLGLFMILPVFALYAQGFSDVTPTRVGLALGIYGLTQALLQIPFGYLSDRIGRRPVIIMGLVLFGFGSIIAAMSQSLNGIILGRSLQGAGAIGSVTLALLADSTRSEVRLRAMAAVGITIALSFGLAFVLGPLLTAQWGVPGIFWLSALFALFGILLLRAFVPNTDHTAKRFSEPADVTWQKSLSWLSVELCTLYFGSLVIHASLTALFLKIPGMVYALGFNEGQTWQFYLPVFIIALIATIPIILFMERGSHRARNNHLAGDVYQTDDVYQTAKRKESTLTLLLTVAALVLSETLLTFLHSELIGLGISLGLFFTAFNILEASLPASISKSAPPKQKGMVLGIFSTMQFLGLFLGGLLGGVLDTLGGDIAVLSFCVILALVWLVCIFFNYLRG